MSDDKLYDYNILDDCVNTLSRKADEIENHAQDLENARKNLLPNWTGAAADRYSTLASDMKKNLDSQRDFIKSLQNTVHTSASSMQEADSSGAKRIG